MHRCMLVDSDMLEKMRVSGEAAAVGCDIAINHIKKSKL